MSHIEKVINKGIPLILIDRSQNNFDIHRVENDHFPGGFAIGRHLAQVGCREIAIIGGRAHLKMSNLRVEGCLAGAASAGINIIRSVSIIEISIAKLHLPSWIIYWQ
ncbi:hypothetical protein [Chitinophaga sp. RAB17]|uniref:hypothetical protein n=1 Tax=Chitinophaga sp. RAB17 TaxID=3233049 RepID=UPI003F91040A